MKRHLGFVLNLLALLLFFPGILLPMFSLTMDMSANIGTSALTANVINKELSLIQTIDELWQDQRLLVAILILLFSICIPLMKSALVSIAYFKKNTNTERYILNTVSAIGKWSMADVFVVAIFLAMLSTNQAETLSGQQLTMFGFRMDLLISSETLSYVGQGFYFFTGYCLLSLLATHISCSAVTSRNKQPAQSNNNLSNDINNNIIEEN